VIVAQIHRAEQVLEAGYPASENPTLLYDTLLYEGPAHLASPRRPWERAAALEGLFDAILHIHTATDLLAADWVVVETDRWRVVAIGRSGPNWRLDLKRREVYGT